jgi:RHS repeat-associated protein
MVYTVDTEANPYYNRARYYDPAAGRFLSEDPIEFGGGINFYAYVHNRVINATDPGGLDARCPSWVPDWLCNLWKGPPKPPEVPKRQLETCWCTRTIVKPQPFPGPGSNLLACFYTCDCAANKKFVILWRRITEMKGCKGKGKDGKDIENCPYQLLADIDRLGNSQLAIPNDEVPPYLEPLPNHE